MKTQEEKKVIYQSPNGALQLRNPTIRHWTSDERQRQATLIHKWKPWNQSTGATTPKGKSISKMNAYKHGARSADVREAAQQLAEWKRTLSQLIGSI